MPDWKRLRLALIVFVEGILICNIGVVKASKQVVEMVKDLKTFEEYPWGRESFELTLQMLKVSKKIRDVDVLVSKFNQSHTSTHGFTLAVQLFLFKTIPEFERFIPDIADEETFTHESIVSLTHLKTFHNENIMEIENQPSLEISPFLPADDSLYEDLNHWSEDVEDPSVIYMERLIGSGFNFTKDIWRGGVDVWPVIAPPSKKGRCVKKTNKGKGKVGEQSKHHEANRDGPFANVDVEGIMSLIDQKLAAHTAEIRDMYFADQKDSPAKTGGSADIGGSKNFVWGKYPGLSSVLDDLNQQAYGGQDDIMKEKEAFGVEDVVQNQNAVLNKDNEFINHEEEAAKFDTPAEHLEEETTGFMNDREEAHDFINHEEEAAQFDMPAEIQIDKPEHGGQNIADSRTDFVELSSDDDSGFAEVSDVEVEEEQEGFIKEGEEELIDREEEAANFDKTADIESDNEDNSAKSSSRSDEVCYFRVGSVD
ncbi:hypothetical protein AALP_AA8G193500 [Arabis alpina]|uniref:DUF1985 domain-containing protein n=1 Tax=Arabis alpina TaxID=50452 RepID=A0A087G821_ARAAL|nr:hypothetical protein AALP_AA8G193500 [Arabis alpina]